MEILVKTIQRRFGKGHGHASRKTRRLWMGTEWEELIAGMSDRDLSAQAVRQL